MDCYTHNSTRFLEAISASNFGVNLRSLDGIARKALTVSFNETALLQRLHAENNGGDARLYRAGPVNPQALNRYAYVMNNPVNATDPTGHCIFEPLEAIACVAAIATAAEALFDAVAVVAGGYLVADAVQETAQLVQDSTAVDADTKSVPVVVPHDTERQAQSAADRDAGIGKHGLREPLPDEKLRPGSTAPQGDPGVRTSYRNPNNGAVVHHDPHGHDYGDTKIGPHYGVEYPPVPGQKNQTVHHTYPPRGKPQ